MLTLRLARTFLKETKLRGESKLDLRGFVLATTTFPCLILGLSLGARHSWESPLVLSLLGVGLIALALFVYVELRQADPMLQVRLFSNRIFALGMLVNGVTQFALFGVQYILPSLSAAGAGLGAAETDFLLFPAGITSFLGSTSRASCTTASARGPWR